MNYLIKKQNPGLTHRVSLDIVDIKVEKKCMAYTGSEVESKVIVMDKGSNKQLTEGVDYTVEYSSNVKKGTAKAKVTGIGEYRGSKTVKFVIR